LQCVAVCCSVLQRVAECCSVLQCVAVCCSVLQCVAVCCSVFTPSYCLINTTRLATKCHCMYCCFSVTKSAVVHRCIWYIHFTLYTLLTLYLHFTPFYCLISTTILATKCHCMYCCFSVTKSAVVYNGTFGAGVSPATKEMPVSQYSLYVLSFLRQKKTRIHFKRLACLLSPKEKSRECSFSRAKKKPRLHFKGLAYHLPLKRCL